MIVFRLLNVLLCVMICVIAEEPQEPETQEMVLVPNGYGEFVTRYFEEFALGDEDYFNPETNMMSEATHDRVMLWLQMKYFRGFKPSKAVVAATQLNVFRDTHLQEVWTRFVRSLRYKAQITAMTNSQKNLVLTSTFVKFLKALNSDLFQSDHSFMWDPAVTAGLSTKQFNKKMINLVQIREKFDIVDQNKSEGKAERFLFFVETYMRNGITVI